MSALANEWEYLTGVDDEPPYDEPVEQLPANDAEALDRANWHVRHVARIRQQRAALIEAFDAEITRLTERRDARLRILDGEEQWHARPLVDLHRALLDRDPKRKTITLPSGTLRARAQQPEWRYGHEEMPDPDATEPVFVEEVDTFGAWAIANAPDLIRFPEPVQPPPSIDKNAVKKALVKKDEKGKSIVVGVDPATGERPPGLVVTERAPEISIDTSTEENDS